MISLFDVGGKFLVAFKQKHSFEIANTIFTAHIQADGRLYLCTNNISDTRSQTYNLIMERQKNELLHRKKDLMMIDKDIAALLLKLEEDLEDSEELALEVARMVGLKGQHKRTILDLQNQNKISVKYKRICKVDSVLLHQGVFTKLHWFQKPIMWCTQLLNTIEKKESMVTEEISRHSLEENNDSNGYLYAVGGFNGQSALSSLEGYDPNENKWIVLASMESKRNACAVTVMNGYLFAVGGYNGNYPLSSVERYDPKKDKWITVASMTSERCGHAVAVMDGHMYALGGFGNKCHLSSVERYDPKANIWMPIAHMESARYGAGVGVINGYMYAVGGVTGCLSSVERYDPKKNKWSAVKSMGSERRWPGVATMGKYIYAVGGFSSSSYLSSVERYNPNKNKWMVVAAMKSMRYKLGAAVMGGHLYAVGGENGSSRLSSIERYNPIKNNWMTVAVMGSQKSGLGVATIASSNMSISVLKDIKQKNKKNCV